MNRRPIHESVVVEELTLAAVSSALFGIRAAIREGADSLGLFIVGHPEMVRRLVELLGQAVGDFEPATETDQMAAGVAGRWLAGPRGVLVVKAINWNEAPTLRYDELYIFAGDEHVVTEAINLQAAKGVARDAGLNICVLGADLIGLGTRVVDLSARNPATAGAQGAGQEGART